MVVSPASRASVVGAKRIPRILVVDDDETLAALLCEVLRQGGFEAASTGDGNTAVGILAADTVDLVILDLGIPGRDGFQVLECVKQFCHIPVVILSGRQETNAKVACLGLGADDYVTKPFSSEELVARCRSVLRRAGFPVAPSSLTIGDIQIDFSKREVNVGGREIGLSKTEFELLKELSLNAGTVLSYDHLIAKIWGLKGEIPREYVHVYTSRLRAKIGAASNGAHRIVAAPGVGYLLRDD